MNLELPLQAAYSLIVSDKTLSFLSFIFCTSYNTSSDRVGLQTIGPTGRGTKNMFVPIPGFSSPLETEQDIDQFAGDIESILVAAAKASTPQDNHDWSIKFNKTSRDIELLVLEKRRHRREWHEHRSPNAKSKLKQLPADLPKRLRKKKRTHN